MDNFCNGNMVELHLSWPLRNLDYLVICNHLYFPKHLSVKEGEAGFEGAICESTLGHEITSSKKHWVVTWIISVMVTWWNYTPAGDLSLRNGQSGNL